MVRIVGLFIFLISTQSFGLGEASQSFTLDGRLYNSSSGSNPLLDNSVNLRLQVLDPNKSCILYEETQNINTSSSNGYFNISVGSSPTDVKRSSIDSGNYMASVYQNLSVINGRSAINGAACTYVPTAGDQRYLRVVVLPSSTNVQVTLSPDMKLNSVPSALVAESLNGITTGNILQADSTTQLNQTSLSSVFSNTNYPKLTSLLAGGGNYVSSTTSSGASLPSYSTSSPPTSPAAGSVWYDSTSNMVKYYNGSTTQVLSTASGSLSGDVTGSLAATTVSSVGGSTAANVHSAELLSNAATPLDTNSMIVKRDSSGGFSASSVSTSSIVARDSASNSVTLQAPSTVSASYTLTWPTAAPVSNGQVLTSTTAGILSWTTPYSDTNARASISATAPLIYNSGSGVLSLGTLAVANGGTNSTVALNNNRLMISSGGAIVEASPLTNGQVFVGSTGAAPVAASLTAGTGVAITNGAGLITISSTGSTGAASGDLSGNYPAPRVAGIQSTPISSSTPTSAGQVLRYDGSTQYAPAFLGVADLRSSLAGSAPLFPTNCTSSQTLTYSAVTDTYSCATISVGASSFGSQAQNAVLAGPSSGGAGAATFRALASSDLPSGGYDTTYFKNGGNAFGVSASVGTTDATSFSLKANNVVGLTVLPSGKVGVGTTSPSAVLQLKAGTTSAGAAPLKFSAGPLVTTAEDGSVEYDGTNYYLTVGTTRTPIPLSGGTSSYSSVGVGAGSSSAPSLTFSGDTNTGFFDSGSNDVIGIAAEGTNIFNLSSAGMVSPVTGGANMTSAAGTAAAPTYSFSGDAGTGWFRPLASTLAASTGGLERMRMDAFGNVGIGTTAPVRPLDVVGYIQTSSSVLASNGSPSAPSYSFSNEANDGMYLASTATLGFSTNSVERMRIDSSGNIGVGTTNPQGRLDIAATAPTFWFHDSQSNPSDNSNLGTIAFSSAASTSSTWASITAQRKPGYTDDNTALLFSTSGNSIGAGVNKEQMRIDANGNVGIGSTNPGARLQVGTQGAVISSDPSLSASSLGAVSFESGNQILSFGLGTASTNYAQWIQSHNTYGTSFPLTLNPAGGNVGIGTATPGAALDVNGSIRMLGSTSGYAGFQPAAVAGSTIWTLPANDGSANQVLTTNGSGVLAWSTPAGTGISSLNGLTTTSQNFATGTTGTTPAFVSGSSTHTLNIPMASAASVTAGLLSNSDYTTFNNKLSNTLADGKILVGNSGGTAAAVTPSGDATMTDAGAFTVTKLQGSAVSASAPTTAGQALRWNGSAWSPGFTAMTDLRSTVTGTNQFANSCLSNQTLTYNSVGDVMSCTNISLPSSQISGSVTAANGGTGQSSYSVGDILYASSTTGLSRLPAGTNGQVLTVASGLPSWASASGGLPASTGTAAAPGYAFNGNTNTGMFSPATNTIGLSTNGSEAVRILANGNVGIGTTAPMAALQVGSWSGTSGGVQLEYPDAPLYAGVPQVNVTSTNSDSSAYTSVIGINIHNNASVQTGQRVPALTFSGLTISGNVDSLAAIDAVDAGPGLDNNWRAGALAFHTAANNRTGIQERMRIDSSGNVGIGTTTPGAALDVKGTMRLSGSANGYSGFQSAAYAGNTIWTLPTADGAANQVLTTNGSGVLSWSTPASGGGSTTTATSSSATSPLTFDTSSNSALEWNVGSQTNITLNINNLTNGGSYTVAVRGSAAGTTTVNCYSDNGSTSLTTSMMPVSSNRAATGSIYNIQRVGSYCYVSWSTGWP